jgi:glutamate/tyrosine decarboxylase-like PLP-dependent enzyme
MVLAQYFNFIRFGRAGYSYLMGEMKQNADRLAKAINRHRPVRADRRGRAASPRRLPPR